MSKTTNDQPDMKVLKAATCKTISAQSTLSYQVGSNSDDTIHVRVTKNTGGGFFSDEWISMKDIQSVMEEHPEGTSWARPTEFQWGCCYPSLPRAKPMISMGVPAEVGEAIFTTYTDRVDIFRIRAARSR